MLTELQQRLPDIWITAGMSAFILRVPYYTIILRAPYYTIIYITRRCLSEYFAFGGRAERSSDLMDLRRKGEAE